MNSKNLIFGLILIFVGILLIGRSTGLFYFDFGDLMSMIIPVGLIVVGGWMIVRKKRRSEKIESFSYSYNNEASTQTSSSTDSARTPDPGSFAQSQAAPDSSDIHIGIKPSENFGQGSYGKHKYSKFIGDMNINLNGRNLATVEVSSFIGDIEIDLRGGKLQNGLNRLVVSSFIGDIRILAPRDFDYFASCSNFGGEVDLLGKQSSGLGNSVDAQTPEYEKAEKKLYIAANNFLGDIRIITV